MRFTKDANQRPHKCVFLPQIGGHHEQGFIEADGLIVNEHGVPLDTPYVSVVALHAITERFPNVGLCKRETLAEAQEELEAAKRELDDLRAQMEQYDKELDAVSYLKGRGYQAIKKTGRPPAKKAA